MNKQYYCKSTGLIGGSDEGLNDITVFNTKPVERINEKLLNKSL